MQVEPSVSNGVDIILRSRRIQRSIIRWSVSPQPRIEVAQYVIE